MEGKSARRCSGSELSRNLLNFYSEHSLRETESLSSSDDDVFLNADDNDESNHHPFHRDDRGIQTTDKVYTRYPNWLEATPANVYRRQKYKSEYIPYKKPRSLDGLTVYTNSELSPSRDSYQRIRKTCRCSTSFDQSISLSDSRVNLSIGNSSINNVRKRLRFDLPNGVSETTDNSSSYLKHHRSQRSKSESDFTEYENRLTAQQQDTLIQNLMQQLRMRKHTLSNKYRRCHEFEREKIQDSEIRSSSSDWHSVTHSETQTISPENSKARTSCPCSMMEKQLMEMAGNAYKNIRRVDGSPKGFHQFFKELTETNLILRESFELLIEMRGYCQRTCGCR